ncbi:hypothetical protein BgiMline_032399, partial [Biomphalaria glabrata]
MYLYFEPEDLSTLSFCQAKHLWSYHKYQEQYQAKEEEAENLSVRASRVTVSHLQLSYGRWDFRPLESDDTKLESDKCDQALDWATKQDKSLGPSRNKNRVKKKKRKRSSRKESLLFQELK